MSSNLIKKGYTYHVRLLVPKELREIIGKHVFSKSLKTSSESIAKRSSQTYLGQWRTQIEEARRQLRGRYPLASEAVGQVATWAYLAEHPSEDHFKQVDADFQGWLKEVVAIAKQWAVLPAWIAPEIEVKSVLYWKLKDEGDLETANNLLPEVNKGGAMFFVLGRSCHVGLTLKLKEFTEKQDYTLPARYSLFKEVCAVLSDLRSLAAIVSPAYTVGQKKEMIAASNDPVPRLPRDEPDNARCLITPSRIERYAKYQEDRNIASRTIQTHRTRLFVLRDWLLKNGRQLDHASTSDFLLSLDVTEKTLRQYIYAGNAFWEYMHNFDSRFKEEVKGARSPFEKQRLPKQEKKSRVRKAYVPEEVQRLFLATADLLLKDLIAIGVYTGCRLSEIGQFLCSKIEYRAEVPYSIEVTDSKTEAGLRTVPIHPHIAPVFQRLASQSKDGYLFPASGEKSKDKNRISYLGKRFGIFKASLGFAENHNFHSFRHTFTTALRQKVDVPKELVQVIVGHKPEDVTDGTYNDGYKIEQKHSAIAHLDWKLSGPGSDVDSTQ